MIQRQCEGAPGTRQALAEYAACCCACGCEFLVWWATVTVSARALYPHTFKKKKKKGKSYSSVALHAPGYCIVWLVATAESCPKSSIQSQIFSLIAPPGFLPPPTPPLSRSFPSLLLFHIFVLHTQQETKPALL